MIRTLHDAPRHTLHIMTEPSTDSKSLIVGIDLGTTNSLVAFNDPSGTRVLSCDDQDPMLPSVVRYNDDGSTTIGTRARDEATRFPHSTIHSAKRLMGRSIKDVRSDLEYLGYQIVEGEHNTARVLIPGTEHTEVRLVSPQEVSAHILAALKTRAQECLGQEITKAVVTVPAYFDDAQRQATRDAGRLAGLEVVRIVNEPTAAALAYGLGTGGTEPRTIAVFDLGGGTFDISILRLTPSDDSNPTDFFQVLATAGDTHLGGDDVDHQLVQLFMSEIRSQLGIDINTSEHTFDAQTRTALAQFARAVKHTLSEREAASVRIDLGNDRVYERKVTRDEFESMISGWIDRAMDACDRAIRDAKKQHGGESIDALIMVGGSTRIPLVRQRAGAFFGIEPYTALDPDKVVAMGAAIQASILSGSTKGSLLLDVVPLSLGIETAGGAVAKLIMRNSTVPTRAIERFSTQVDGQVNIKLNIVQGEREMVEDCRSLGEFELRGIPPMPAGVPKLVVEFLVDANGILNVSALEERSGKRTSVQVVPNHGLTNEEVDRIEAESFTHARSDMTRHQIADLIANSTLDLKWISERFEKHRDELEQGVRADLESKMETLRGFIQSAQADWSSVDPNAFHDAKEDLDRASMRVQEIAIAASLRDDQD
ncbi:MAG: Fe-S protein assembly chaperone HscA [Phycisphaerales bacterium]|nr:Fe-S protein assembly chaperone HscA [Phycisphaerales bacterium]